MQKITLTQAIHDLKTAFRKRFGPDYPIDSVIEELINYAATRVKKGELVEWTETDKGVSIKFSKPRRWRATPSTNPPGGGRANPTERRRT